jgi:regulator of telomere elongation helicase 1
MDKVIHALTLKENALLESPTGTGKTLSLLCAALAWQQSQDPIKCTKTSQRKPWSNNKRPIVDKDRLPTIIYASRTHSQLTQVVKELKQTCYNPRLAILASRDKLCINPLVKTPDTNAAEVTRNCKKACKTGVCSHDTTPNIDLIEKHGRLPVMDMEDLAAMGQKKGICPYYLSRALIEDADLIVAPYNYLFDGRVRLSTFWEFDWSNSVVILDEAHNLENIACESASFELSATDLDGCIRDINRAMKVFDRHEVQQNIRKADLEKLKMHLSQLKSHMLDNIVDQQEYPANFMLDFLLIGTRTSFEKFQMIMLKLRSTNEVLVNYCDDGGSPGSAHIEHVMRCLDRVYKDEHNGVYSNNSAAFRVYTEVRVVQEARVTLHVPVIHYWCFDPSVAMDEIMSLGIRSIIATSGTLSPLSSYSSELGVSFPHTLENLHIISDNQIHVRVIGHGVTGKELISSFNRRKDTAYITELGNTIVSLAKVVPDGVLVFFPSYSVMYECLAHWGAPIMGEIDSTRSDAVVSDDHVSKKANNSFRYAYQRNPLPHANSRPQPANAWTRLLSAKSVVVEPRAAGDLKDAIAEFHKFLSQPASTGCVLMGVCRGKISEGIDFANEQSRAVLITGLPFPPIFEPKVRMKKQYLDSNKASSLSSPKSVKSKLAFDENERAALRTLTGHEWYKQQAHRAVNQAIGRVIRNRKDYGAVLLLDSRFGARANSNGLSKWLRPHVKSDEGFGRAISSLSQFYKHAEESIANQTEMESESVSSCSSFEYDANKCISPAKDSPSSGTGDTQDPLPAWNAVCEEAVRIEEEAQKERRSVQKQQSVMLRWLANTPQN